MLNRFSTSLLAASLTIAVAGCSGNPDGYKSPDSPAETAETPTAVSASGETEASTEDVDRSAQSGDTKPEKVWLLGDPQLTAGIPGEGLLELDEIEAWLADPSNHEPLRFKLPLGLAGAELQIQGVDENPFTLAKIELGRQLYFDPRLSSDGTISCAECHHPDEGYSRQTQFGIGIGGQQGNRNTPVSYNRIISGPQFWDGRAATLEEQAVGPIANPIEMGNTHEAAVGAVKKIEGYRIQFEKIFGDGVNIDDIARAIAAFERVIVTGPSPYDFQQQLKPFEGYAKEDFDEIREDDPELYAEYEARKAAAEAHPMSESARRGQELFFSERVGCSNCHAGANFTDEKYYNLGVGMDADEPDLGRFLVTGDEKDKGAFKTPTVRNVEFTAPYMHDGSQKTLEEVVDWYDKGGHPNPYLSDKIKKLNLTSQEKQDLVEFMKSLSGEFPVMETGRLPQ